jgi:hypothetical protein
MHTLSLPAGCQARLHILPGQQAAGTPYVVVVAAAGREASPDGFFDFLREPGGLAPMLTHNKGLVWTDKTGEALLSTALERGGIAMMLFVRLADALACQRRIRGMTP